jgi:alanyl aminopeptidase
MRSSPKLWLASAVVLLLVACGSAEQAAPKADSEDPFRLAANVVPTAQEVSLRIDPAQTEYSGSTTITIDVSSPATEIRLHAEDMDVRSLRLSIDGNDLPVTYESGQHGLLHVTSDEAFARGSYRLHIEFSNDFNVDGESINRTESEGRHYIFSQFEAVYARQAFPCFDEPGFKFPWQLTISAPEDMLAITNTPEESVTTEAGWTTTRFAATPALPSYLIAVAVGPFETVPIDGMSIPGRIIVPQGKAHLAAYAVETTPPLLAYLEDYFGEPYPFRKLDLIATFQSFSGAMEHPGAITYSDYFLLLEDTASVEQKNMLHRITAHELAHQWFGNLVTMRWWNDLWLNESFADWMADKTVAAVYPGYGGGLSELTTTFNIMDMDARPTTQAIRRDFRSTDSFQDGIFLSYYKGKAVLSMFEEAVGADVFRKGVIRYLRKFNRGNAEAADLWAEINAGAEFDLARGLASFIDQPGIPLVSVSDLGDGRFEFVQSRLVTGGETGLANQSWIMPVMYRYRSGDGVSLGKLLLDSETKLVDLGTDVEWILPNADQLGYFRWTIPTDMLDRLGEDAPTQLNVRERMGMLSNLWALLATDAIDAEDFLGALDGMSSDSDPGVINALLDQLGNVRQTFITPDLRDEFAIYVRTLLSPALERIGTEPLPDEEPGVAALRPQLLLWLADHGRDETARAVTAELTAGFLASEIPFSDLVGAAMRAEARRGDQQLFEVLRARFDAAASPNMRQAYLQAIGSFRDPDIVARVLEYVSAEQLRAIDIGMVLYRLSGWADNHDQLLTWLMEHDAQLRERLPPSMMVRIPDAITVCSPDNLETIKSFYGAPERSVSGIDNELADSEAEVMECWEFRQRELASVTRYLGGATT